ncbi:hypothetical protein C8R44DRAFT_934160 [Mycena epipterygia]|nr:hypothetical protein C8R44DRAFT_934160 [Mycena epipterygia]
MKWYINGHSPYADLDGAMLTTSTTSTANLTRWSHSADSHRQLVPRSPSSPDNPAQGNFGEALLSVYTGVQLAGMKINGVAFSSLESETTILFFGIKDLKSLSTSNLMSFIMFCASLKYPPCAWWSVTRPKIMVATAFAGPIQVFLQNSAQTWEVPGTTSGRPASSTVLDGGEHANIVLTLDPGFIGSDFSTGVIELLSWTECTGSDFWTPKICSNMAVARIYHSVRHERLYAIIDWHAQQYCVILLSRWHNPTHRVKVKGSGENICAGVISTVYEDPRHCGNYRLWLSIPYTAGMVLGVGLMLCGLLYSFRLSVPGTGGGQFIIRQRTHAPASPYADSRISLVSYSGRTKSLSAGILRIVRPDIRSAPFILKIPEASAWSAQLLPYNGAVGYGTAQTFVLTYFE